MKICILGAHNTESENTRYTCFLIDGLIAIDAGALTASLSFKAISELKAVLLTHEHFDHIRDIPTIAFNLFSQESSLNLVCTSGIKKVITKHLFNKTVYPQYHKFPRGKPTITFQVIWPGEIIRIGGYEIIAIPIHHTKAATGFLVSDSEDKRVFFSSDTGPGFLDNWKYPLLQTIVTEVTMPNRFNAFASQTMHLTPKTLADELIKFNQITGRKPNIIVAHRHPAYEQELTAELNSIADNLDLPITIAKANTTLEL